MRSLTVLIDNLISIIIITVVGLIPLILTSFTTEYFESAKIVLLLSALVVLILLWTLSWVLQGKVTFTKTPLDLPLLLLLIVIVTSAFFSDSKSDAIYGNFPRVHGSATSWVAYILFYFVAVSHIKSVAQVKTIFYTLVVSSTIVAIVALISYFNIYLPFDFAKVGNFNLTGSSFSTVALLLMLLPPLFIWLSQGKNLLLRIVSALIVTLFMTTILLTGGGIENNWTTLFSPAMLAFYFTLGLSLILVKKQLANESLPWILVPLGVSLLIFVLGFIPGKNNFLLQKRIAFPHEIQLPISTSWQISGQSFVANPFLGSGPATYGYNFTSFKSQDFNLNPYWNLPFDTATNEYLQILGTLGALGFLAFFAFSLVAINFSYSSIIHSSDNFSKALAISGLTAILLLLVHVSTPVVMVTILIFLAMIIRLHKNLSGKVEELSVGIKASKLSDSNMIVADVLPLLIFIAVFIGSGVFVWQMAKAVQADFYHRQALNVASKRGIDTYNYLVLAEHANPKIALYRTDLAQTNFALANSLALAKGPTEASPAGYLTDDDKLLIQKLLSQSVTEGRVATTLSPRNSQNWVILAGIYRQISGVAQNANDFALDAYGRAIQRDPNNPVLRLNVGGIYYSAKNYELAVRFFNDAANLKQDYANAFYNLSIALKDKGDLQTAYLAGQRVVALLQSDPNNQDYKTASQYLADLKTKIDTAQKENQSNVAGASVTPPAAEQNSALQKENILPNGVDLGQKPKVSTPSAVKNSKSTPAPSANP